MIAPGDILYVQGTGGLGRIGAGGGYMGHMLVALCKPQSIRRHSSEGEELQDLQLWPRSDVPEVWRVSTMESTRLANGLHVCDTLLFVEPRSRRFVLFAELDTRDGEVTACEHEYFEVWQSPADLRAALRMDLLSEVVAEMKLCEGSWSIATAARALFLPADVFVSKERAPLMDELQACWSSAPICTSVAIVFWQRYLCKLAASMRRESGLDLILRWMPAKADRALPSELAAAMHACGWSQIAVAP